MFEPQKHSLMHWKHKPNVQSEPGEDCGYSSAFLGVVISRLSRLYPEQKRDTEKGGL